MVVRMKPDGSLEPGWISLAITPAIKPMMMVQRMLMKSSWDYLGSRWLMDQRSLFKAVKAPLRSATGLAACICRRRLEFHARVCGAIRLGLAPFESRDGPARPGQWLARAGLD